MGDKLEDLLQSGQISSRAARQMQKSFDAAAEHQRRWSSPSAGSQVADIAGKVLSIPVNAAMAGPRLMGDVAEGRVDPTSPEGIRRSTDVAGTFIGGGAFGAERGALGAAGGRIKAYHGSPHDFERFDMSKIGTGEGAQSYGRGLYFAENEKVAKAYRDKLARPDNTSTTASFYLSRSNGNPEAALRAWDDDIAKTQYKPTELEKKQWSDIRDNIASGRSSPGRMYEVGINAHPDEFLDWDKPLKDQHPTVQQAIRSMPNYERFADMVEVPTPMGEKIKRGLLPGSFSPEGAADTLKKAGIPGIKYLDQSSRTAGGGSRNYVVFDDNLVDVMKKYGMAGLSALPAAGAYHFQRQDPSGVAPDAAEQMPSDTQAAASYLK